MLKLARWSALVVAGSLLAAPAFSQDKAAATVNGVAIPQSRLDMSVQAAIERGAPDNDNTRTMVRENLIEAELFAQEAEKKGLDKQAEVRQELDYARKNILAGAYAQDYVRNHPISEDTLRQEYDNLKAKHAFSEYHVSHIVVAKEDEAKAIAAQIKKGAKFEKIAKEKSKDPGSAKNGGDIPGNHKAGEFAQFFGQPYADAVTALKKGDLSAPVQSKFGWHIIRLNDSQDAALDEVKPDLMQYLQRQSLQKAFADLRKDAKIE